jgi:arylsulfatase A-like enzyme
MRRRPAVRVTLGALPRRCLLALAAASAACRSEPPPLHVAVRLVDRLDPASRAFVGTDCAPYEERRPSLGCTKWNVRLDRPVSAPGTDPTPVLLPRADRHHPLIVKAELVEPGPFMIVKPLAGPWIEPSQSILKADLARIAPADAPRGSRIHVAIRATLPENVTTAPVDVPRGAVLSIALALDRDIPRDGLVGVEFVLTGEQNGDRHELLRAVVPATATAWDDRRIPLDAFAGDSMQFHFATRVIPQSGVDSARVTAVPLWGAPEILAPADAAAPPNVVLVSLDTLRADHVGAFGETRGLTPHIDALAAAGTAFENAITTYPSTTYAHLSMLSGLYPRSIGPVSLSIEVPNSVHMLAQHLGRAGWVTGAVTEDILLAAATGFPRGFSTYHENVDPEPVGGESRKVEKTIGTAVAWLERHAADRVFLFVHTYVVHWPYSAPTEFQVPTVAGGDGDRPMANLRAAYAAEVRYADTQIARLVDTLERLGIASRTILIVTSDHGEEFGEHGKWSHSHTVYDELLRVPLVLWAPGRVPAGKRIRTPTSLTDVLPTVLDLVGLPPVDGIDGESQGPRIRGTAPEEPNRVVFAEVHPHQANPYHMVAAHTLAEKWIATDVEPPKIVAYDLVADRGEHAPLDDPARVDRGRGYLARYEATGHDQGGPLRTPVGPVMEERLKALGYVQ